MATPKKFPFWGINKVLSESTYLNWNEKAVLMLLFAVYYAGQGKPFASEPKLTYIKKTLGLRSFSAIRRLEDKGLIHLNYRQNAVADFDHRKIERLGLVDPGYFDNWD